MRPILSILFPLAALLAVNCSKEYELANSIFIADSVFSDLPAYSEWGYNTFGAYFDREVFISNIAAEPGKVICTDSTNTLLLKGQLGGNFNYYSYGDNEQFSAAFILKGIPFDTLTDLVQWNDTIIDLTKQTCQVLITEDTVRTEVRILNGNLHIKRVQVLRVDGELVEVILSGRFAFQMIYKEEPYSMSEGRFDVGISEGNFFRY